MKNLIFREIENRIHLIKIMFLALLITFLTDEKINSQVTEDDLEVIRNKWLLYSDAPNSLYHYITAIAYEFLDERNNKIAGISSLSEWQQRQQWIQKTLLDIVGPFPEKTPLNAKITRIIEKDSFRIEHVIYESQPGFYVTSSLFIPTWLKKRTKLPAILYCSGHSAEGYRSSAYQHVILNLVKKGFIVFAFDPVGQGERLQYYDPESKKSIIGGPTLEHSYPGSQAFVTGSSLARYMIWDGIRAVDYLLTRKEVDATRIGITGRSGGGTQSAYIAAMDNRIYAAAPECYITNFKRLLESIGNQDAEQNFFNGIIRGIDHPDLLLVRAPKPALMITTTRDMFSIQGAMETEKEVSRIYKAYGKEDNFSRVEDDFPHESTRKNREAMYAFFQKHLNNPGSSTDEKVKTLTAGEMRVTTTGQISTSYGGETIFSLNLKEGEKLISTLQDSRNELSTHISKVLSSAIRLSGYQEPSVNDEPVFTGRFQKESYAIEKYFIKGEGDYVIPYLLMVPSKSNNKAVIYLHPEGKAAEASAGGEMEWFVRNGFTVLSPDLIGIGELGPGIFRGDANIENIPHNIWYASILIGRSIVGIRAGDVVKLVNILKKNRMVNEIYGLAVKEMAPVLLHAAALSRTFTRVALIEPYCSYSSIVMNRFYKSSFIYGVVPGAIKEYDLPDLAASLAPVKLLMAGVTDGSGKTNDIESIKREVDFVENVYKENKAESQLRILIGELKDKPFYLYGDWIN